MDQFAKYMVFGTQIYGIWKIYFNVETYIRFMHSEPAIFFLPKLPLQVSTSATHLSKGWNWTGWKLQNQMLSFPQKHLADGSFFPLSHLIPIPLSCLHSVTKAIWDSQKNGVADAWRPLPTVLSSFSLIPYPFFSSVFTSSARRFELPRKTVRSFFPLSHSLPVPLICFHFVTEAKQRTM